MTNPTSGASGVRPAFIDCTQLVFASDSSLKPSSSARPAFIDCTQLDSATASPSSNAAVSTAIVGHLNQMGKGPVNTRYTATPNNARVVASLAQCDEFVDCAAPAASPPHLMSSQITTSLNSDTAKALDKFNQTAERVHCVLANPKITNPELTDAREELLHEALSAMDALAKELARVEESADDALKTP